MSNSILNIDMITRKSLEILENNLVITRNVNRQYDDSFTIEHQSLTNEEYVAQQEVVSHGYSTILNRGQ